MTRRNRVRRGNRPLARYNNGVAQNPVASSRADKVSQVRKFQIFDSLSFTDNSSDYSLGLKSFNLDCNYDPFRAILAQYRPLYEQYRIRKVCVRCQVGKGYTNDRRIQTIIGARVDVDEQLKGASLANVQAINGSENTVIRTLAERGNVLLAEYRPIMRKRVGGATADDPVLPSHLQWYPLTYSYDHLWKGCTVTGMVPDPTIEPDTLGITIMQEVVVEFRGRVTNDLASLSSQLEQGPRPESPQYDIHNTLEELRTKLYTGEYFPLSPDWPTFGDIGGTVTDELVGLTFRVQATPNDTYKIVIVEDGKYGANKE